MTKLALVTGAGGFIGGHLVPHLLERGYDVIATDSKFLTDWYQQPDVEKVTVRDGYNLYSERDTYWIVDDDIDTVFHLASDMGGIGYISGDHDLDIILHNTLMDSLVIRAAIEVGVKNVFYASSACVYPTYLMQDEDYKPLKESAVYPAYPNGMYGWQKLHTEHMLQVAKATEKLTPHIARFQNVFGTHCAWRGGREKVPAALARKVAIAKLTGTQAVEIWGDGRQSRSFLYVGDCVKAVVDLSESEYPYPITLGPSPSITINELLDLIVEAAGIEVHKTYVAGPQGVRARHFDHNACINAIGWMPTTTVAEKVKEMYDWVEGEVKRSMEI